MVCGGVVCVCVLTHVIAGRSGRLSESRADCQSVGQTVRESGRLSESRETFFSVVTTTFLVICISGYFVSVNEYKLATGNI